MSDSTKRSILPWLLFVALICIVVLLGLLASDITHRRAEAQVAYRPVQAVPDFEPRNELWAAKYPAEGKAYMKNHTGTFTSKYNGSTHIDMLEVDPRLVILWAGYGFSKDYNQGRGHLYAVEDVYNTLRTGAPMKEGDGPMPSTCWTCKSPDVPRVMNDKGIAEFYKGKWFDKGEEIVNSIGCGDCHNPKDMSLHITRPALVEAFQRMGEDISKASHQEMRSLVCAQCHVEYYFNKKDPAPGAAYLTLPWDKGMSVEAMEEFYDAMDFKDWTHKLSKAPMLKAQHPGYEVFKTGIHARRGLACADCHMPYKTEGGLKFTDHHIRSPLDNIANTCQVCHRESEAELREVVYKRQDQIIENRDELERLLVRAHVEAKTAWDKGAKKDEMKKALKLIRHAQWRWDYAAASHGGSFHSPVETSRIIATGITKAQEARLELTRVLASLGVTKEIPYPDIATKAKAQEYIGLDVKKLKAEKAKFLREVVPKWKARAAEREKEYPQI